MILKKKTFNQPNDIDYLVYLPDEYYNDEKSYPLVLFLHGEKDDVIPVESSLLIYKYLKEKNKNIHFTTYPNITHDSWTITYENKEVYDWLLSFKRM